MQRKSLQFLTNLRSIIILMVVVYHTSVIYQHGFENQWIVSDPIKSKSIGLFGMYANVFGMAILFFISGYFMSKSARKYKPNQLIINKLKRLLLPWFIATMTLIPLYKFIFLLSRGLPQESWETYFHYFSNKLRTTEVWSDQPTQQWLWFLPVLFLFQVIYLLLKKWNLLHLIHSLKTGTLIAFIFSFLTSVILSYNQLTGWHHSFIFDFQIERILVYLSLFLLGSLFCKLNVFSKERKSKKINIMHGVLSLSITCFTILSLNFFFNIIYPERSYFFITKSIDLVFYYGFSILSMFTFLFIILDFFQCKLNKTNTFWQFINRNSYQIYLIHMIFVGIIGLVFISLKVPVFIKFPCASILIYLSSYYLINFARHILGKKIK